MKGNHLSVEGIRKGYLFRRLSQSRSHGFYIKGVGVGPRCGTSPCKHLLSTPTPRVFSLMSFASPILILTRFSLEIILGEEILGPKQ